MSTKELPAISRTPAANASARPITTVAPSHRGTRSLAWIIAGSLLGFSSLCQDPGSALATAIDSQALLFSPLDMLQPALTRAHVFPDPRGPVLDTEKAIDHVGIPPLLTVTTTPMASMAPPQAIGLLAMEPNGFRDDEQDFAQALRKSIARFSLKPGIVRHPPVVTQEIRYQLAGASEVVLVWGINGWSPVDESLRLPGTTVTEQGVMHTPMSPQGDGWFVEKVKVPYAVVVTYGFWITKAKTGLGVSVWDANGYPPRSYTSTALGDRPTIVMGTVSLDPHTVSTEQLVTRTIIYRMAEAGEVRLLWGINGWHHVAELIRPAGTTVLDGGKGVMSTPMSREEDRFVARVSVPVGSTIDYSFWITKSSHGAQTHVIEKDGQDDFHVVAKQYGGTTVTSQLHALP
jgi:hypothetical protein